MKITRIQATPLHLPVTVDINGRAKTTSLSMCLVDIETDTGLIGTGMTAITEEEVIASIVNDIAAHALLGMPIRCATSRSGSGCTGCSTPRGQSGYASHAISAIDLALVGHQGPGVRRAMLAPAGRGTRPGAGVRHLRIRLLRPRRTGRGRPENGWRAVSQRLKMTVGPPRAAAPRRTAPAVRGDYRGRERLRAVRDAVGPDVQLYIDANCSLDYVHALHLAQRARISASPSSKSRVSGNDVGNLVKLRAKVSMPLAAGQNEGLASRFRDLLVAQAVDVVQPNVCITGGYTQCLRIAGMAQAFNTMVANGGAWPHHNMHLHAGLAQRHAGRIPLGRGGLHAPGVRRPGRAAGRLAGAARGAGAGLQAQPRAHRRAGAAAAVARRRQGLTSCHHRPP
jgi:L-rhamnonate dehydratase